MEAQREMTLQEWMGKLPSSHCARKEYDAMRDELARLRKEMKEAHRIIQAGKDQFAPHTTNSDADEWLKRYNRAAAEGGGCPACLGEGDFREGGKCIRCNGTGYAAVEGGAK